MLASRRLMGGSVTTLDETWGALLAGRREEAARVCVAILEADSTQVGAASLLARVLPESTPDRLVEAFIRRGDLATAVAVAARVTDPDAARRSIAEAFGAGSARVDPEVSPAPPPLPPEAPRLEGELRALTGAALGKRARRALSAVRVPQPEAAPLPKLPLFGSLAPAPLQELLRAWHPRAFPVDARIVREGDEGRAAYVVVRGHVRVVRGDDHVLAELGPGALFGEMALVSDAPRAASVIANEPVLLLEAPRDELEALAKKTPRIGEQLASFCRERMLSNLLRHGALLGAVSPPERRRLFERFEPHHFARGEALVRYDEEPPGLFLLASGGVEVVGRDADGASLELARLGPGDVVGEMSLVLRRPASADVLATHPTVALELKREQFQSAIKEHPELLSELYELATKRDEETRSVVAQEALDVEDVVLV